MSNLHHYLKYLPNSSQIRTLLDINKVKIVQGHSVGINIDQLTKEKNRFNPFYLVDMGAVIDQYLLWNLHLPNVKPFFAVKSSYSSFLIRTLSALGCGFDTANKFEMEHINQMGVPYSSFLYANTIKQTDHLLFARLNGVNYLTFDNIFELKKIQKFFPEAKLILRIKPVKKTNPNVSIDFSSKFGAGMEEVEFLIHACKELDLDLVGVSFHVGYRCSDPCYYKEAIENSRVAFNLAQLHGFDLKLLDLGGGFPGYDFDTEVNFMEIASVIRNSLDDNFSDLTQVKFIAEPGRFFAARSQTLAVQVIGLNKIVKDDLEHYLYYLNDGKFGSFMGVQYGDPFPKLSVVGKHHSETFPSTLFGPTCDSQDVIVDCTQLPRLSIGSWIYFENFGAYSLSLQTQFNLYPRLEQEVVFCLDSLKHFDLWLQNSRKSPRKGKIAEDRLSLNKLF